MSKHLHEHVLEDGTRIVHSHSHEHTEQVKKRLNNIIGHLHGVLNMVEEERDCADVLIQLSAVNSSIRKLKSIILKDHVEHCIVDAVKHDDDETIKKLKDAIDKMLD